MTRALSAALRGMWEQSWRLLLANAALSAGVLPFLVAALWAPVALVGAALVAGPLAMALMHCAVELVRKYLSPLSKDTAEGRRWWSLSAMTRSHSRALRKSS